MSISSLWSLLRADSLAAIARERKETAESKFCQRICIQNESEKKPIIDSLVQCTHSLDSLDSVQSIDLCKNEQVKKEMGQENERGMEMKTERKKQLCDHLNERTMGYISNSKEESQLGRGVSKDPMLDAVLGKSKALPLLEQNRSLKTIQLGNDVSTNERLLQGNYEGDFKLSGDSKVQFGSDNIPAVNKEVRTRIEQLRETLIEIEEEGEDEEEKYSAMLALLQREINMVGDERYHVRRDGLLVLCEILKSTETISTKQIREKLLFSILKPALKRFADEFEQCRQYSIELVLAYVNVAKNIYPALVYILPVLIMRLNKDGKYKEPSEDLRHLFALILHGIVRCISKFAIEDNATHPFSIYLDNFAALLAPLFLDHFDSVLLLASTILQDLSLIKSLQEPLKLHSKNLLAYVSGLLLHKHAKIRVGGLQCMQKCMYLGAAEYIRELTGFREANVVPIKAFYEGDMRTNYFGKMTTDENLSVRSAFYSMIAGWWKDLPERFDYETLLMPYLLSGLSDPNESIQKEVLQALNAIGNQYHEDHAGRLREELLYAARAETKLPQFQADLPSVLFPPFATRPQLGTRNVISGIFPRLLPAILHELKDWHNKLKQLSLCLLRCLLLFSEDKIAPHVITILPALVKMMQKVIDSKLGLQSMDAIQNDPFYPKVDLINPVCCILETSFK